MPLIKCPECGKEISDKAFACPNCGNPSKEEKPILIEQTRKKYKKVQLVSVLILLVGFFLFLKGQFSVFSGGNLINATSGFGFFIILIGIAIGMVSKIGAWWNNR